MPRPVESWCCLEEGRPVREFRVASWDSRLERDILIAFHWALFVWLLVCLFVCAEFFF